MIRALARKELRELRPWAVLAVVVWIIDLIDDAVRKLDQRPLSLTFHGLSDTSVRQSNPALYGAATRLFGSYIAARKASVG